MRKQRLDNEKSIKCRIPAKLKFYRMNWAKGVILDKTTQAEEDGAHTLQ